MTRSVRASNIVLAVAALAAAFAGHLPVVLAVPALATTFLVTPGLLAARPLFARFPLEGRAAAALVLAPFLAGAPVVLLMVAGAPVAVAARAVALAVGAWALAGAARPAADAAGWDANARVAWGAALVWTALVGAVLVGNRFLPLRADGWFHAGVALQVLERGLPPEDQYFAGLRMLYFWGQHAWAAAWLALAPRLLPTTPLIAFNLSGMAAVVLAVGALTRRIGGGPRVVGLAAALTTLGYSPFTWAIPFLRSMTGEVRGWAELSRDFTRGADGMLDNLAYRQLHESMAFFGDKGLVLTQFGMGMACLPLVALALLELEERLDLRATLAFAFLMAAALFGHAMVGYAMVMLTGAWWLVRVPAALRGDARARGVLVRTAVAVSGAGLLLSPYLWEFTHGKQGQQVGVGFVPTALVTMAICGFFYVVPGFLWLARERRASTAARLLLVFAAVLFTVGLVMHLPQANESKFDNLLFVLLPAPAALTWDAWRTQGPRAVRRLATLVLLVGAVPTVGMAFYGFLSEHGQAPLSRHEPSPAVREAVAWAAAHTPADAAFCDIGGGVDLVAVAGRSVLWGGYDGERDYGYPPAALAARRDLAGSLCRGRDPGPDGMALLRSLRREVIVMVRTDAPDSSSDHGLVAARPERFRPIWSNAGVSFWRVRVP